MMILSKEELEELTGRKQKCKIREWLFKKGIPFVDSADGYPKVSKKHIEELLSGGVEIRNIQRKKGNAKALKELMGIHG